MRWKRSPLARAAGALAVAAAGALAPEAAAAQTCERTITANVVAFDQFIWYNRLGAREPEGMMYALEQDVEAIPGQTFSEGHVRLRPTKRPRPLTLRANVGDCLRIHLRNLLDPTARSNQPASRRISAHVVGMQLVNGIQDDGSFVGANTSSLIIPGQDTTYTYYAEKEGTFLLYSTGQTTGGDGDGGTLSKGLFGAVNVEPRGAEWYRSQVTRADMALAQRQSSGVPQLTAAQQPVINYAAVYPVGHPLAGRPILAMLGAGNVIQHSDLTAIITGPNKGNFAAGTYPEVQVEPNRLKPFREFTIIFHDEIGIRQAFDKVFNDPALEHTLHSGRDAFAINYGTGGIGAEVIANRFHLGPMANCSECKYEEFFLTSWAVGDPAMVVDVPADADLDGDGELDGDWPKATKALYPDDPSNVYHSYMNDHVKFRNLHAGPKEHHIFHLHAHQWLHSPNGDNSTYLDSQAIGPAAGFTYEITYNGGGNRNKTPGDAIFHCHFYPHFAQGMWSLWRVHDVFEQGTLMGNDGRVAAGARALPDGEISGGTPIPAVVPLPTYALAPMPTATMPGYPFYIPGKAGHRPPRPPLDVQPDPTQPNGYRHGGLARHVVTAGAATNPVLNRLDFSKVNTLIVADSLPEDGTPLEVNAMAFHAARKQNTWRFDPNTGAVVADSFITNGRPPVAGAPYADPCVTDVGGPAGIPRTYRAAGFQLDARYNKAGWHFPQHRMFALWSDVDSIIRQWKAPEPMFIRANTNNCVDYHLVNLIPKDYELDDFQVKTPTDIIGQHIHLVKFDVTSSDGSANGFNYEDGSMSPGEVRERIRAIRKFNSCTGLDSGDVRDNQFTCPVARAHPAFGAGTGGEWVGAMETISRWYVDDVLNRQGVDRTLRTVFTHDHFGPSTHQQTGLYAGLVTEPKNSTWRDPENGVVFGTRDDGGPTSWRADIHTEVADSSYREFNLQLADFTLAYQAEANLAMRVIRDSITGHTVLGMSDPARAINPPGKFEVGLPDLIRAPFARNHCPSPDTTVAKKLKPPCPELLSADDPGTMSVNYRNEPIALRVRNPAGNTQAAGIPGDLAHVFRSDVTRSDTRLNAYGPYGARTRVGTGDPFTPLLRAYEGDKVQIRVLVGAHEEGHNFSVHGVQWRFEPSDFQSGWRNSQMMGISEHYEFVIPPLPHNTIGPDVDYLYRAGSATDDLWNGTWGIMRATQRGVGTAQLNKLPSNNKTTNLAPQNAANFNGVCPTTAASRNWDVTAALARDILPHTGNRLEYNSRSPAGVGPIYDPNAIMYVRTGDLNANGTLKTTVPIEPLVLRVLRGDCVNITLRNRLPEVPPDSNGYNTLPPIIDEFNANDVRPSGHVGLHTQLLAYDVTRSDGVNVGNNPIQTAAPNGGVQTYKWYAGILYPRRDTLIAQNATFGAVNLMPADPIEQASKGAIGALVVETAGIPFTGIYEDTTSRLSATLVNTLGTRTREHVLLFQTDLNLRTAAGPIRNLAEAEDPEDSGQKGANYRTEPFWFRKGFAPETPLDVTRGIDMSAVLSNGQVGGPPQTPVFRSEAGQSTLIHLLEPGGHARNSVFNLHGHIWEELPWAANSFEYGTNTFSEWKGALWGHGPTNHAAIILKNGAGGKFQVRGDYLWRDQTSFHFSGGIWGLLKVVQVGTLPLGIPITQ